MENTMEYIQIFNEALVPKLQKAKTHCHMLAQADILYWLTYQGLDQIQCNQVFKFEGIPFVLQALLK